MDRAMTCTSCDPGPAPSLVFHNPTPSRSSSREVRWTNGTRARMRACRAVLTSGSGRRLADAELLEQAGVVPLVPTLDDLAVLDLVDRDARPGDVPAGRRKAHQVAVVGGR